MAGSTLAQDQRTLLGAKRLWDNYHYINSFVTINGQNAQRAIYTDKKVPFCMEDFVSLSDNNFAESQTGEKAEVEDIEWSFEKNTAVINYRAIRTYDTNLQITILE